MTEKKDQKVIVLHYDDNKICGPTGERWLKKMGDTLRDSPDNYTFLILPKSIDVIKL